MARAIFRTSLHFRKDSFQIVIHDNLSSLEARNQLFSYTSPGARFRGEFLATEGPMAEFRNFGELYRAAFAERDSEKKLLLLHEVHVRLNSWEQSQLENDTPSLSCRPLSRKPVSSVETIQAA